MNEVTTTNQPKYKTMPALIPVPSDALIFRRRWAEARDKENLWQMRRQLARDYAIAKCSAKQQ